MLERRERPRKNARSRHPLTQLARVEVSERRREINIPRITEESESRFYFVDVHTHLKRFKRSHRQMALAQPIDGTNFTRSNGHGALKGMQGIKHLPESLPAKHHWREVFRNLLYRFEREWEPVTVNKSIDSVTMPKWIAIGILGAVLTFGVQSWWRSTDQRDMLIELKTELRLAKEYDAERAKEAKQQQELNKVYIDNMTGQLNVIKGMLSAQQMNAVENAKKGSN